jgi:G3E family GTPase
MSLFERDRSAERLPVSVITGFLGSGKTTVLRHLLRQPGMGDSAVIVNELGEVGLDHLLLERVDGETALLASGCVCCALRGDLEATLRALLGRARRGAIPAFRRVLVETTGVADPAPICQLLLNNPLVGRFYRLGVVLTAVDAVHARRQLEARPEAVKQTALADRLLVTKTDLAGEAESRAVDRRLAGLNPAADRLRVPHGVADPERLLGGDGFDPERKTPDVRRWLAAQAHDAARGHAHGSHAPPHDRIRSFVLSFDTPLAWPAVHDGLARLRAAHGERLLRVKGLLALEDVPGPVVVHGVHHVFHPPVELPAWPDGDHRSRLVFVTDGLDRAAVEATLAG